MSKKYDFSGWATKYGIRCSDGRNILSGAFQHNDGARVPLVWNHQHNDPVNILGYADLSNRKEGTWADCAFNATEEGQRAKQLVQHGDIGSLSIYANHLQQNGRDVAHGNICEVSLVLHGANPGALIDVSSIAHSDGSTEEEAIISMNYPLELSHADDEEPKAAEEPAKEEPKAKEEAGGKTVGEIFAAMSEKKRKVAYYIIAKLTGADDEGEADDAEAVAAHADTEDEEGGETVADVVNTFTEEELAAIATVIENAKKDKSSVQHSDEDDYNENDEGDTDMSRNCFDRNHEEDTEVLSHADIKAVFDDVQKYGTLKGAALAHGIDNIEYLFPDAQNLTKEPIWYNTRSEWVAKVMNGTSHSPFSRVRTKYADITGEDARAKGFMKGHKKTEEVFEVLKRTTEPQTIYKKQSMHKDDIRDIIDFDVVAWVKGEMRVKLEEELARAILIGDGRSTASDDKIFETNIRPIWKDDEVYTIHHSITVAAAATRDQIASTLIDEAVIARKDYRGSGKPTLFTTEDYLTYMLLLKDNMGHRIYKTEAELATAMRVDEIVTVPQMENQTREVSGVTKTLAGIIVNLKDYNVGADKGGKTDFFEDFDIDYNKEKYLLETRASGALVMPKAAIALELSFQ